MSEPVVLKWFREQQAKGVNKAYTIKQVYNALKRTPDNRCLETVWSQIVKLRETGVLVSLWTMPVKYKLKDNTKE